MLRFILDAAGRGRGCDRLRTGHLLVLLPTLFFSLPVLRTQEGPPPRLLLDSARNHYTLATYNRENAAGDPTADYSEAIGYYLRYLEVAPELTPEDTTAIYEKVGECHFFLSEYEACLPYFSWALDRGTDNAYLAGDNLFAGYAVWQIRGLDDAVPYYARYVELMPDDYPQRRVLAGMYRGQKSWDEAADHYLILLAVYPDDDDIIGALLNIRLKLPARFEEISLQLVEYRSDTPLYLLELGRYYTDRMRFEEAVEYLHHYLEARPGDIDGWEALAAVYRRTGEIEEAIDALRRIVDIEPESVSPRATMGEILIEQGRLAEAIDETGRALALETEDPFANKVMGDIAREWILNRHRAEHPGEAIENMRYNLKRFVQEIVVERYFEKARRDPRWRSYCENQIAWLSAFFPGPADRHMARPEDRELIVFPPPS